MLEKCQGFLENSPYVQQALQSIYHDIFDFHQQALKYFRKPCMSMSFVQGNLFLTLLTKFPVLRQIFQETWPKYKTKFGPIIDNLKQHKQLVEGRITFTQLEMAIGNGQKALEDLDTQRRSNENIQHRAVRCWLNSADVQVDQESASSVLFTNDKAGKWLIQHHLFQAWQDFNNKDSLLWLTGIPGAGRCCQSEKNSEGL